MKNLTATFRFYDLYSLFTGFIIIVLQNHDDVTVFRPMYNK